MNPSEKAMQLHYYVDELRNALSEHKRVLELAEKALTGSISYVNCFGSKKFSGHKEAITKANEMVLALAEIAKLRKE